MPASAEPAEVMPGAEPFAFPGGDGPDGRTGVLLVHGFTGTPMSMRPWGEHLAAAGFAVRCPLLPGHGTRWQDCNESTHGQWTTAVEDAFDELGGRLVAFGMGDEGLADALRRIAAHGDDARDAGFLVATHNRIDFGL